MVMVMMTLRNKARYLLRRLFSSFPLVIFVVRTSPAPSCVRITDRDTGFRFVLSARRFSFSKTLESLLEQKYNS